MELQELYIYQQQLTDILKDNLERVQVFNHQNHNLTFSYFVWISFYHYRRHSYQKLLMFMFLTTETT